MKKQIIMISVIAMLFTLLILPIETSFAKEQTVKTTLPNFSVSLNGNKVNNQNRQFPLLVYKDITYFPMTWYDSRLLGIEASWSPENGLDIEQKNITSSFEEYPSTKKNAPVQEARIIDTEITVNGKKINNAEEKYPLLSFRDVTYFPLTWKFAHAEFNWEYDWNGSEGLSVNSNNKQLIDLDLPEYASKNSVAVYEGYYYFVETVKGKNNIYRVPENNIGKKELVYSYDVRSGYGSQNLLSFKEVDEKLWFSYHLGGGFMGSDYYCKIDTNGKATEELRGYLSFKEIQDGYIVSIQGPADLGNLMFMPLGGKYEDMIKIGNPKLLYTSDLELPAGKQGGIVYASATLPPYENEEVNKIYQINITTNESTPITDFGVDSFKIINNKLYYVKSSDRHLYSANLDGSNEKKLSDHVLPEHNAWYDTLNGTIYYETSDTENNKNIYKLEADKEDSLLLNENIDRVIIENGKIIAKLTSGADYGMKMFDGNGDLTFTVTDQIYDFFAHQDKMILVLKKDKSIKIIE